MIELDATVRGCRSTGVSRAALLAVAHHVLAAEGVDGPCSLGVALVPAGTMRELNGEHRGRDEATDVLSFPIDGADDDLVEIERDLGDVVICPEVCREQAERAGIAPGEELRTLLVHGLLHLLDYDHEVDAGEMLARQSQLLADAPLLRWEPRDEP